MKTGHRAIQLHASGPRPSTCLRLEPCMPNGNVLNAPTARLPSGCACAHPGSEHVASVSIVAKASKATHRGG